MIVDAPAVRGFETCDKWALRKTQTTERQGGQRDKQI